MPRNTFAPINAFDKAVGKYLDPMLGPGGTADRFAEQSLRSLGTNLWPYRFGDTIFAQGSLPDLASSALANYNIPGPREVAEAYGRYALSAPKSAFEQDLKGAMMAPLGVSNYFRGLGRGATDYFTKLPEPAPAPGPGLDFAGAARQLQALGFAGDGARSFELQGSPMPAFRGSPGPAPYEPFGTPPPQRAAPTPVDFGPFEQALTAAAPTAPSADELQQLQDNYFLQGLAQGAAAAMGQPIGSTLLSLGAGALGGYAQGKQAQGSEKKQYEGEKRQHQYKVAQTELGKAEEQARFQDRTADVSFGNEQLKYNAARQQYQDKKEYDRLKLAADQGNAAAKYAYDLKRWELGLGKVSTTKNGIIAEMFDPDTGKRTINVIGTGGSFDNIRHAASAGKSDRKTMLGIAADLAREQGPEGLVLGMVEDVVARGGNIHQLLPLDSKNNVDVEQLNQYVQNELAAQGLTGANIVSGKAYEAAVQRATKSYYVALLLSDNPAREEVQQKLIQLSPLARALFVGGE